MIPLALKIGGLVIASVGGFLGVFFPPRTKSGESTRGGRFLIFFAAMGLVVSIATSIYDAADQNRKTQAALDQQKELLTEISRVLYDIDNLRLDVQVDIPVDQPHVRAFAERIRAGHPNEPTVSIISWLDSTWPDTAPNHNQEDERALSEFVAGLHPTISFFNPAKVDKNEAWSHSKRMIFTLDSGLSASTFEAYYGKKDLDGQKVSLTYNAESDTIELLVRSAKPHVVREAFYLASILDFGGTEVDVSVSNPQSIKCTIDHITLRAGAHGRLRLRVEEFTAKGDRFVTTIAADKEWR